jgi:hypothetical protein
MATRKTAAATKATKATKAVTGKAAAGKGAATAPRGPLPLIVMASAPAAASAPELITDRLGGEVHTMGFIGSRLAKASVSAEAFADNLDAVLDNIESVLARAARKAVSGWKVETLSVSLAVSAEGSIGVATAGVEGSIALTFKRG